MYRAIVSGPWGEMIDPQDETGSTIIKGPQIGNDFNFDGPGEGYATLSQNGSQVTPDPNINTWNVTCSLATLNAIEAHNDYLVHSSQEILTNE